MMALWRHALLGAGEGSCGPPTGSAGSCACCLDGTRAHGVCGGRVGGAGALPAQRDSGPLSSCAAAAAAGLAAVV